MNLEFCEAKKENIKDMENIINIAYRKISASGWTGESHLLSGIRVNEAMLEEMLEDENIRTFLAKKDDKVLATIQVKKEDLNLVIGLFAVDTDMQSSGIGKKLLEFAENRAKDIFKDCKKFIMEVISSRTELIAYYNRRGYKNTDVYLEFPKSDLWAPTTKEEIKLLVLEKEI
ncbi:GNAT family N-acetyltransferase [Arcobacter porcinus]|uniref:Acetyltransferase n=1 Tax=Arcobacter porcinus TaxID=1935204 RepID=A0ABX2YCL3_9BACT|nr:GNAT family N-acetyltransferase [Arcobacter porcinus]OCL83528.1 putative acetyltransferase [Arcobacter porcinus]OCL83747.1 putative acetyltransferase [Arcobacter porcinus]OCL87973.1 putative acetyltransferase [Arcobacter porcinus]OCL92741.1 putative acetyltransferase [Arcobacter porcinus]